MECEICSIQIIWVEKLGFPNVLSLKAAAGNFKDSCDTSGSVVMCIYEQIGCGVDFATKAMMVYRESVSRLMSSFRFES